MPRGPSGARLPGERGHCTPSPVPASGSRPSLKVSLPHISQPVECACPSQLHPPPYLASSNHLLSCIHCLATAGAPISTSHLLGHPGCVGVGGSVGLAPAGERSSSAGLHRSGGHSHGDHRAQPSSEGPRAVGTKCWPPGTLQLGVRRGWAGGSGSSEVCPQPHPTLQAELRGLP